MGGFEGTASALISAVLREAEGAIPSAYSPFLLHRRAFGAFGAEQSCPSRARRPQFGNSRWSIGPQLKADGLEGVASADPGELFTPEQ
jgi:hypothetical protein